MPECNWYWQRFVFCWRWRHAYIQALLPPPRRHCLACPVLADVHMNTWSGFQACYHSANSKLWSFQKKGQTITINDTVNWVAQSLSKCCVNDFILWLWRYLKGHLDMRTQYTKVSHSQMSFVAGNVSWTCPSNIVKVLFSFWGNMLRNVLFVVF